MDRQGRQARTSPECTMSYARHVFRNIQGGETDAVLESVALDLCDFMSDLHIPDAFAAGKPVLDNRAMKNDISKSLTVIEGIIIDLFQVRAEVDGLQAGATIERILADACQAVGEVDGFQFVAVHESTVPNAGYTVRNADGDEGASGESIVAYLGYAAHDADVCQVRAAGESIRFDGFGFFAEDDALYAFQAGKPATYAWTMTCYCGQGGTVPEGIIPDLLHMLGNGDGFQAGTVRECKTADYPHAVGNRDGFQIAAAPEGSDFDGGDSVRDDDRGLGLVPDTGYGFRIGTENEPGFHTVNKIREK